MPQRVDPLLAMLGGILSTLIRVWSGSVENEKLSCEKQADTWELFLDSPCPIPITLSTVERKTFTRVFRGEGILFFDLYNITSPTE